MKAVHYNFLLSAAFIFALFITLAPIGSEVAHATSPITISTCTQLQAIGATSTEPVNGSYVLSQNVDCSATATWNPNGGGGYYGFSPIPDFTGTLNGAGYSITNLYISTTTTNVGLFSTLDATSTVENLTLSGGSVSGTSDVGTLAGQMIATSTVQNVTSSMTVTGHAITGGLVGFMNSASTTITNSSATGPVSMTTNSANSVGGLVGSVLGGTISSSFATGSVTANGSSDEFVGGLVGYTGSNSPVLNSYATGNITASGAYTEYVGGLIGESESAITNAYETGSVTANGSDTEYIAGFIGENAAGAVASSSASGTVTATGSGDYISGFIGYSYGAISNSFETGTVTATTTTEYIAGFDGYQANTSSINQCYETGSVTGGGIYSTGGFVGGSQGTISKSFSTGNVTLTTTTYVEYAGGFAGWTEAALDNDYSTGNVTVPTLVPGEVYYVGGFNGNSGNTITNSYSTGSIIGNDAMYYTGGFVGYNEDPIINSYSTGGGSGLANTTSGSAGYFVGNTSATTFTNDAELAQGTPAIGNDGGHGGASDALLATHGYGTDESTLSNFYSLSEPVYAQATSTPWDFTSIWETHPNTFPTFIWYSGVQPTYTITATAGTGGVINNSGAFTVQSGANQTYNIIPSSGYSIASVLVDGTSVGSVSTYTFTNVSANHTISVTFTAPIPTTTGSGEGGSSGGGDVPNQVSNLLQDGNSVAATALEQQYPKLFAVVTTKVPAVVTGSSVGASEATSTSGAGKIKGTLSYKSHNKSVKILQQILSSDPSLNYTGGVTGYFGRATQAAVELFQTEKGIATKKSSGYGIVGPKTRAALIATYGS